MKNQSKVKIKTISFAFSLLLSLIIVVAVVTPHIIHNFGLMPENYAQSVVLIFDLAAGYFLYVFYKKVVENVADENEVIERRLLESFKYIGKVHGRMEASDSFVNYFKQNNYNSAKKKDLFILFLSSMLISAAKVDQGLLRFINLKNGRTFQDYFYSKDSKQHVIKLSNSKVMTENIETIVDNDFTSVKSDFDFGGLRCVLTFPKRGSAPDFKLLRSLLNQTHLIFVALKTEVV